MTQTTDMLKVQLGAAAGSKSRTLLKTTTSAPDRVGLGSHAGSHTDEQPRDAPNLCGQPGETNPRSRTNLNGDGRPHWNLRIRRSGRSSRARGISRPNAGYTRDDLA